MMTVVSPDGVRTLAAAGEGFEAWADNQGLIKGEDEAEIARWAWQAATAAANVAHEARVRELETDKAFGVARCRELTQILNNERMASGSELKQRIATLELDLTALADEVERRDTYWNREKHQYEDPMLTCPARVRELIAERRKEGK